MTISLHHRWCITVHKSILETTDQTAIQLKYFVHVQKDLIMARVVICERIRLLDPLGAPSQEFIWVFSCC